MKKKLPMAPVRANGARHVSGPRDLDRRARARSDRFGQRDQHHGFIVRVVVVRSDVAFRAGEVTSQRLHGGDLDSPPTRLRRVGPVIRRRARARA